MIPPRSERHANSGRLMSLAVFVVIVAALHFAKVVLIPVALAVLISFLLAPVVSWLEHHWVKRTFAVILVITLSGVVVASVAYVVAGQLIELANKLPEYRVNIVNKARSLRPAKDGTFTRAREVIQDMSREVASDSENQVTIAATTATAHMSSDTMTSRSVPVPTADLKVTTQSAAQTFADDVTGERAAAKGSEAVAVRVIEGPASPLDSIKGMMTPVLSLLTTAGLVILFVIFMLLQQHDLRDRLIRLAGQNQIKVTTSALDEASSRVSRYLLMQLIINATYGIPVAVGLWFIGVPNALLWGVLATILRFIPYIGPWIAASIPIALSLAVFDGWTRPVLTVCLFVVLELISNNFMEPILYGHTTGVSPVAIIVSAVFWTWLWGGVGLVLATPITVCLVVVGRHVPQLGFLNVLFGDEPVLPPDARLYNRLLSDEQEEAFEMAEKHADSSSLSELYDKVLIPALGMAERDRHMGDLSPDKQKLVLSGVSDIIESVNGKDQKEKQKAEAAAGPDTAARLELAKASLPTSRVLCLPARDVADEIAAVMLSKLLTAANHTVRVVSVEKLASEMMSQVDDFKPDLVYISAMPPLATTHARYLCKRLKAHSPELRVIVGLWNADGDMTKARERLNGAGVDEVVKTLSEALEKL